MAGNLTVSFAAHAIGNYEEAERRLDAVGVFIIVSNAPYIGARANVNIHTMPLDCWEANKAARVAQAAKRDTEWRGNPGETVEGVLDCALFQFGILILLAVCDALSRADLAFAEV
jgi:hypothetical protein